MTDYTELNQEASYPERACVPCLFDAGDVRIEPNDYVMGKCSICGQKRALAKVKDFGYPVLPKPTKEAML